MGVRDYGLDIQVKSGGLGHWALRLGILHSPVCSKH